MICQEPKAISTEQDPSISCHTPCVCMRAAIYINAAIISCQPLLKLASVCAHCYKTKMLVKKFWRISPTLNATLHKKMHHKEAETIQGKEEKIDN